MSNKYVKLENLDPEQINCYYGGNCRIEDVQDWINDLPVEEGLERVVHCSECVFANNRGNGRYDCPKTNSMHKASYFCADGLSHDMLPYWKRFISAKILKLSTIDALSARTLIIILTQNVPLVFHR